MKNRYKIMIAEREYTLVAEEDEKYVKKVADYAGKKIEEIIETAHVSVTDAAILASTNIADEYFKAVENSENLRRQLKEYLEEATKKRAELMELRRELSRLKSGQ